MTYGTVEKADWQNVITIRPGPVLHVWRSGSEFCNVPLSFTAALELIGKLTAAMQMAGMAPHPAPQHRQGPVSVFSATPFGHREQDDPLAGLELRAGEVEL